MGIFDFILFPFYVVVFYFLFDTRRKKYNNPILQHYHKIGFWIRVMSAFAFSIFNVYISRGDSIGLYYTEGVNIYNLILKDSSHLKWIFLPGSEFDQSLLRNPLNQGYFRAENNYMVTRLVTVFSFFSLGKYLILNLVFSMVAYSGVWRLYRFFYEQYPHLHKQLAIAILYLPTFVFWSSGILKDSICISALGWLTYSLYELLYKKKNLITNFCIIALAGYMLSVLKVYILVSYLPFFFLFLVLKNMSLLKSKFAKVFIVLGLVFGSMVLFTKIMGTLTESLGEYAVGGLSKSMEKKQQAYTIREANSSFSLGVDLSSGITMSKLALVAPAAIIATLYRPFLWESRNVSTLLSSFESLFIMFFTLYVLFKYGIKHFITTATKDPVVIYCISFSLLFALFVGATTSNFGSLVRYKIPCMPFYVIAIFLIEGAARQKKENLLKNKQVVNV